ncbi:S-layer homology domain-containing protein, partial [Microcoleus sp. OTE_8_concoct_300]|uniref:S-layer homology domain-containing protein n=1 Tax=Microcoleus sp. OTE_8_concoct_300 TaxID=2964710 RepID=UPI00403F6FF0
MVKNSTSVKAFWLSFLISGVAVPLGASSATAQIQDTSTPEVALEGSAVPVANPASALAAVKIEIPQLAAITAETNSAVDRPEPETDTATVDRPEPETDTATVDRPEPETDTATVDRAEPETDTPTVDRAEPETDTATVDRAEPETDTATVDRPEPETDTATVDRAEPETDTATVDRAATAPEITAAMGESPPQELEIANSPQSQNVAEGSKVDELSSETGTADDLSIQEDAAQVTSVSQLSDVRPTDWAFGALQSLVERYGCIAGYPDGTFRGNRAMTR